MIVALAITLAVGASALTIALTSRGIYETDSARSRLSQTLSATKDFLVNDIRQSGERLPEDFPAIEIIQGSTPADPDVLVVRRNLLATVLKLCEDLSGDWFKIAVGTSPPPGCSVLPIEPGDTYPSNLEAWMDFRLAQAGQVSAYLFNPVNGNGEFFEYDNERENGGNYEIHRGSGSWVYSYPQTDNVRLYLLEERRYELAGDVLRMIVNQDPSDPVNLVDGIENFQLAERWKAGSAPGDPWTMLRAVDVAVTGRAVLRDRTIERSWSAEIMPRNVIGY